MLRTQRTILPSLYAAMNSDSVDEVAMVSWSCVLYATVAPASLINDPVNERWVQMQEAQSALLMPCAIRASCSCRCVQRRSCSLLRTVGSGIDLSSGRGVVLQK